MKKKNIVGFIVIAIIFIGLVIFASTKEFEDSHLRIEGVRVRLEQGAMVVDGCNKENETVAYCEKKVSLNDEDQLFVFEFKNFKENGYPSTFIATLNGHEFYRKEGLMIEEKGSLEYPIFLNFEVMGEYIVFTFTNGASGRATTLYALDTKGNIVLEEKDIDQDDMKIKDYTDFIKYDKNTIEIYATRVESDINYKGKSICDVDGKEIVEAKYVYTLKKGKFSKKQIETISAAKFIENQGIECAVK